MEHKGHFHPSTQIISEMSRVFSSLGFSIITGPEVESAYYNFDSLNIPKDHPARDIWDTFWLKEPYGDGKELLRTHTSPMQVRYLEGAELPCRIIVPGKVFRNETTDATHEVQFHQIEGFMVEEGVTLATLKTTLEKFFSQLLGDDTQIRFRPGYFPFVEPGLEVDILRTKEDGTKEWTEVLGAGMIHPKVLENAGVDSKKYSGFAFGLGVERMAMLRFGITDVRDFFRADLRLLNQF